MAITGLDPFPKDALEANRAGQLTTAQRDRFRPIARSARQSMLVAAVVFVVAAAMMRQDRDLPLPDAVRVVLAGACLILAAYCLVRAIIGADALTRDLRHMRVQSSDGAIGKRLGSYSGRGSRRPYYLEVGDGRFRALRAAYDAAPEAGMVRIYFLPRSRRVVNLERLADPPLPPGITSRDVLATIGSALLSGNRRGINELRAQMAPVADAARAAHHDAVAPPPLEARDPRPLDQAIVGTWRSPLMSVVFERDGDVTATMFGGMQRSGRWSVDRAGRLISDVTGQNEAADAWVAGDQLTILADGSALTFTREPVR